MNDLTEGFRLFREMARVVWNCGLRLYPDGEHEFINVEDALFTAMVASQATHKLVTSYVISMTYYPQIKVVPTPQEAVTVLVAYEQPGFTSWKEEPLAKSADLRLGSTFDFDRLSGSYRDFRYVFCADVGDPKNIRGVLIDANDVTLTEVVDEQPT